MVPNRWASGPDRSSSRHSASVGSPGGSSEKRCPRAASSAFSAASRSPPPTTQVRSPGSYSRMRASSEPLCKSRLLERMGAVRTGHLAAEARRGEDLAGVRETARVERRTDALHHLEVDLGEHQRHRAGLVRADAVLAGDRAPGLDACLEDSRCELLRAGGLACDAAVVEHERVEVAVARMEDVADA